MQGCCSAVAAELDCRVIFWALKQADANWLSSAGAVHVFILLWTCMHVQGTALIETQAHFCALDIAVLLCTIVVFCIASIPQELLLVLFISFIFK